MNEQTIAKEATAAKSEDKRMADKEMVDRIAAFDSVHTKEPLTLSDEEIREERLRAKYEIGV